MFGERLRQLRQNKGLTQEELASIVGVDRTSIGKYETTDTIPSRDVLLRVATYFGVSLDFLLGNDNNALQLDDIQFALFTETKDVSDETKQDILDLARVMIAKERAKRQKKD